MLGRNGEVAGVVVEIDQRAPKSDRREQLLALPEAR